MANENIIIHTDGSSLGNPGKAGWAAVLSWNGRNKEISGGYRLSTNNRMELMAVLFALKSLKNNKYKIILHTDSNLIVNTVNKGWMKSWKQRGWKKAKNKPVMNLDLIKELDALLEEYDVDFRWIKAHAGHAENERCDELAKLAAESGTGIDKYYEKLIEGESSLDSLF
jgi:ribonuclease HI